MKKIGTSKYKYVTRVTQPTGDPKWRARPDRKQWGSLHDSEEEAGKIVDLFLIRNGQPPVNVLKKVVK